MSVWKKLNKQDVFTTSYLAKKTWSVNKDNQVQEGVYFLPFDAEITNPKDCRFLITVSKCDFTIRATKASCDFTIEALKNNCNFTIEALKNNCNFTIQTQPQI